MEGKITLFLMTEKGYFFLKNTLAEYKSLYHQVVIGSDSCLEHDFENEIIDLCVQNEINFCKKNDLKKIDSEYALAISWRWLINHPSNKLIVFHDSVLPKYRGFSPLVNSLIKGEGEIGVSAIFGASDFDTGDIIIQSKSPVSYPLKISDAIKIINRHYLTCGIFILKKIYAGCEVLGEVQDESNASYSIWRDEDDYLIDWSQSAIDIKRFIDATGHPFKGAKTLLNGKTVRIINAEVSIDVNLEIRQPGKVLFVKNGFPVVICGEGMLTIHEGYIEGKGITNPLIPITHFRTKFTS